MTCARARPGHTMCGMVLTREAGPGDWETMREIRLAALQDAPEAFASTYTREAAFTEEQWRARFHDRSATYLAYLDGTPGPAGIAGVYEAGDTANLVSMWVRPSARGRKAAEALITACADWARARGHDELFLWVTESNEPARRLYRRCGFTPTGQTQPLPSDPSLPELQMSRKL